MDQVNEAMKVFIKKIVDTMVSSAFSYKSDSKMRKEMKEELENAVIPILKKYGYICLLYDKMSSIIVDPKSDQPKITLSEIILS